MAEKESLVLNKLNVKKVNDITKLDKDEYAIIGIGCKFPGANNADEFWNNLLEGKVEAKFCNKEDIKDDILSVEEDFIPVSYSIDGVKEFDYKFFKMSKSIAKIFDPQLRKFLEICWHCFEDANFDPFKSKKKVGVFVSSELSFYLQKLLLDSKSDSLSNSKLFKWFANSEHSFSGILSYFLSLNGPAINIGNACASSLASLDIAMKYLDNGECNIGLVGGINLGSLDEKGYLYEENTIFSNDGYVRSFDEKANGVVFGKGGGVIMIKPLKAALNDNDHIYAVIKSSCVNNDGNFGDRPNFTAPSVIGQSYVIENALRKANVSPESIGYIETHGTATRIGDVVEFNALKNVFVKYTKKKQFCYLGAVKQNIGHLDTASGIAGIIKTALVLHHKIIPKNPLLFEPNKFLRISDSPFVIKNENIDWKIDENSKRIAGVSSFGMAGNSSHVIMEEFCNKNNEKLEVKKRRVRSFKLILLSAQSDEALKRVNSQMSKYLTTSSKSIDIDDFGVTLQVARTHFSYRRFIVADSVKTIINELENEFEIQKRIINKEKENPKIAFLFPGQGSQYPFMTSDLYDNEKFYKKQVDYGLEFIKNEFKLDLYTFFVDKKNGVPELKDEMIHKTKYSQLLLFIVEYSLSKLLIHWGIKPDFFIGHSIGEYVALCLSEVFSFEDGLKIIYKRSILMDKMKKGSMISVVCSKDICVKILSEMKKREKNFEVELSLHNSPENVVVSGDNKSIGVLQKELVKREIICKILNTSHAFHSTMMDPMVKQLREYLNSDYLCDQLRNLVEFNKSIQSILEDNKDLLMIEVGPMNTLCKLVKLQPSLNVEKQFVISITRHPKTKDDDQKILLNAIGNIWKSGCGINWMNFNENYEAKKTRIPVYYPFEREECFIPYKLNHNALEDHQSSNTIQLSKNENNYDDYVSVLEKFWKEVLSINSFEKTDSFFELGGDSLSGLVLFSKVKSTFKFPLNEESFLKSPTFEELCRIIEEGIEKKDQKHSNQSEADFIIKLNEGSSNASLFIIHGVEGIDSFTFNKLVKFTKFLTVYSINDPKFGKENWFQSFDELVIMYCNEIKKKQNKGPFNLSGYSFGGFVAIEVCKRLIKEGHKVSNLLLIDPLGIECFTYNLLDEKEFNEFLLFSVDKLIPIIVNSLKNTSFRNMINIEFKNTMKLLIQHFKSNPSKLIFQGNIVLFKCLCNELEELPKDEQFLKVNIASNGLNNFIEDNFETIELNTSHFKIFKDNESMKKIGSILKKMIIGHE